MLRRDRHGRDLPRRAAALVVMIAGVLLLVLASAPPALAHTDFDSSDPSDGALVDGPLDTVTIRFTAAAQLAGDGVTVRTPSGDIVQPEVLVSSDETLFTVTFDKPLDPGTVGVRWSVRAGDAHPIEGVFSFTIVAGTDPDGAELGVAATGPGQGRPSPSYPTDYPLDVATSRAADEMISGDVIGGPDDMVQGAVGSASTTNPALESAEVSLDEFMQTATTPSGVPLLGGVARTMTQGATLIAIGVVAFVTLVSGRAQRLAGADVHLLRRLAVVAVVGSILRVIAVTSRLGGATAVVEGWTGLALLLQVAGSIGLVVGAGRLETASSSDRVSVSVGAASGGRAQRTGDPNVGVPIHPSRPSGAAGAFARLGAGDRVAPRVVLSWPLGLLALSYAFDGHTVSSGTHLLMGVLSVVHVIAGGIWIGGIICLLRLVRNAGIEGDVVLRATVRFSVLAAVALAVVGVAGLAMTITILDSVSELWSTPWGRLLVAKTLVVAVAAAAGAYNHFVLVPEIERRRGNSADLRAELGRSLTFEAGALIAAVALTAFLVTAAS